MVNWVALGTTNFIEWNHWKNMNILNKNKKKMFEEKKWSGTTYLIPLHYNGLSITDFRLSAQRSRSFFKILLPVFHPRSMRPSSLPAHSRFPRTVYVVDASLRSTFSTCSTYRMRLALAITAISGSPYKSFKSWL